MGEPVVATGALEYVQSVVARCKQAYADARHRSPCGLLRVLYAAFELDEQAQRVSRSNARSSSSIDVGIAVHRELELAAAGAPIAYPHQFTRQVVELIRSCGWVVVASEVPLVVADINLYTRIDLVLFEPTTNTTLLAELKTGRDTGYRARLAMPHRQLLDLPAPVVRDSQHTRAHLQLAWMTEALQRQYAVPKLQAIVIRVNARGACVERLAHWARRHSKLIYERVCMHRARHLSNSSGGANN